MMNLKSFFSGTMNSGRKSLLVTDEQAAFLFKMLDASHVQGTKSNLLKVSLMIALEKLLQAQSAAQVEEPEPE
jgi:hypothetical protein